MDMESWTGLRELASKVTGKIINAQGKALIYGQTKANMLESGSMASVMEKELWDGLMERALLENGRKIKEKD